MSSLVASTLALLLCAAVLAPLAWAASETRARTIAVTYLTLILVVTVYSTGFFQRSSLAPTDVVVRAVVPGESWQCREVLDLMRQAGLRVDRSDLSAPRIVGNGADQIPREVGEVLIQCAEAQAPASAPTGAPTEAPPIVPEF